MSSVKEEVDALAYTTGEKVNAAEDESEEAEVSEAGASKKGKKKKKNKTAGDVQGDEEGGKDGAGKMDTLALSQQIASLSVAANSLERGGVTVSEGSHLFWSTQPMRRADEQPDLGKPIDDPDKEIRQEPYNLPGGFVWAACDIDDESNMNDIYQLLNQNYVEDDDNMFRFDYSKDFLRWALKPPGFKPEWHVCVRADKSGKLVGFITAVPADMRAWSQTFSAVEINFLCVHKKLRSKRLAPVQILTQKMPVLIKEVTRRVNVAGIFQAVYTAGAVLPTPVASCRYYHRSLNPKKLIEVGFSRLAPRMTMARTLKLYKLPDEPLLAGLRPMQKSDVAACAALLNQHLAKFSLAPCMTEDEVEHWFLSREGVIYTYVIQDAKTSRVTDLLSFYALPSTIIGNKQYPTLNAAYAFYNVANTVQLKDLLNDALVVAKSLNFDVFNALNILGNGDCLNELKFGIGDGQLQYYLYNWSCRDMRPSEVGLVLL